MKRNLMALSGMLAFVLACGDGRTSDDTGAAGTGSESGALPGSGIEDTTAAPSSDMGTPSEDTAADTGSATGATDTDSASGAAGVGDEGNQDQSGVTNTETGESELGDSVSQTSPDQGEPVTSKGDTIGTGGTGEGADTGTTSY